MSKEDLSVFEKHVLDDRVNTAKSIQEIKDTLDDTIKTEEKLANEIYLNRQRIDSLELLLEKAKQCTQKDVNAD